MSRRKIGQEIIQGLEEINAWRRSELKLETCTVEMPRAADVPAGKRIPRSTRAKRVA
jgi:hypothetical protein